MRLTSTELAELRRQQLRDIVARYPAQISKTAIPIPCTVIVPLLVAQFSRAMVLGALVATGVYFAYAAIAFIAWRWAHLPARSNHVRNYTVQLAAGYDSLVLLFLSMTMLSAALFGSKFVPFDRNYAALLAMSIHLLGGTYTVIRISDTLRNRLDPSRIVAGLNKRSSLSIAAAGTMIALVVSRWRIELAMGVVFLLSLILSLLLAHFAVVKLFEAVVIARIASSERDQA
jgi:hypothetical protein